MRRFLATSIAAGLALAARSATVTIDQFLVLDPADPTKALSQYNGNRVVHDGFYLSALLNGAYGGQVSTDSQRNWSLGVGVDALGFSRSVNNDGTTAEALELHVSPDAAKGAYGGLGAVTVGGGASLVVIAGFAGDPRASSANGTVAYASNAVAWTQSTSGGTIDFANPAATPPGTTLRFSNGRTTGTANQFGLVGFSYADAATPVPGEAGIRVLDGAAAEVAWHGVRGEAYRLQRRPGLQAEAAWSNATGRVRGGGLRAVTNATNSAAAFYRVVPDRTGMVLGANVNEVGTALEVPLLEQSRTEWMRVFFPVKRFLNGSRDLASDADLEAVKRAVLSGRKLVLCLKLNFDTDPWRVPEPGTPYETDVFQWVEELMAQLDGMVSVLETVNEVMIDTHPDDLLPGTNGVIPMVRFLQRLVDRIEPHGYTTPEGAPLPLYSGGFTRLYDPVMQARPAVAALLDWVQGDDRLAGANFHIHARDLGLFQDSFDFIRQHIPGKPLIVTEFSLVWKYKENLEKPLSTWPEGSAFASQYGYGAAMLVRDYVNLAITNPVAEAEWNGFLDAMPWYDTGFLGKACSVMESNGTAIATFAFQQASSGGQLLAEGDTPWILNPIFANYVATNGLPPAAINTVFFNDYLDWGGK